jgi:hypothetical protein
MDVVAALRELVSDPERVSDDARVAVVGAYITTID